MKKAVALLAMIGIVGVALGMVGLLRSGTLEANQHSATRSFDMDTIVAGGSLEVTIEVEGLTPGFTLLLSSVNETLPNGFTYESRTPDDIIVTPDANDPQVIAFGLFGQSNFTYTVTVPDIAGTYNFSGVVVDAGDDSEEPVNGASMVTVTVATEPTPDPDPTPEPTPITTPEPTTPDASATRSFSSDPVDSDGELVVTLTATGYGTFGQIVETLPAGFDYESSPVPGDSVDLSSDGRSVTFTLLGEGPFTYTVTTPSMEGSHSLSGVLTDEDRTTYVVGGNTSVTVESLRPAPAGPQWYQVAFSGDGERGRCGGGNTYRHGLRELRYGC